LILFTVEAQNASIRKEGFPMNKAVPFIVAGAVIAGAAAFYFWYWTR